MENRLFPHGEYHKEARQEEQHTSVSIFIEIATIQPVIFVMMHPVALVDEGRPDPLWMVGVAVDADSFSFYHVSPPVTIVGNLGSISLPVRTFHVGIRVEDSYF